MAGDGWKSSGSQWWEKEAAEEHTGAANSLEAPCVFYWDETGRSRETNRDDGIKEISNVIHGGIKGVRLDYILLHHSK